MTIDEKIFRVVCAVCADEGNCITDRTRFSDLSIDSLSFVELIVTAEDNFNVAFSDRELLLSEWETAGDFVQAIKKKIRERKRENHIAKHKTVR